MSLPTNMASPLPTIVLVPGACHSASCYDLLVPFLNSSGFPTKAITLPSLNPASPSTATCAEDAKFILETTLQPLINEGKDILLVGHSYAGIPIGGAALGLSKTSLSRLGRPGGVIGLVYMTAFIVPAGKRVFDPLGGQDPPTLRKDTPSPGLCVFDEPAELFYNDATPEVAARFADGLLPHAYSAFQSASPSPAWAEQDFQDRLAYIKCTEDQGLPLVAQEMMMQATGLNWNIREISAGHSPFASKPKDLADLLESLAKTL